MTCAVLMPLHHFLDVDIRAIGLQGNRDGPACAVAPEPPMLAIECSQQLA